MTAFERMKLREQLTGTTIRATKINNSRARLESLFADDPTYQEGIEIIRMGEVVGTINARIQNYRLFQNTIPNMDIIDTLHDGLTFRKGDVVRTKVIDQGIERFDYWLCVDERVHHDIQRNGLLEQCNFTLRWQNKRTYEIIERWCSVRDPYTLGIYETPVTTVGNAKYKVKLPYDNETKLLHINKRFIMDFSDDRPVVYTCVKYDSITSSYAVGEGGFVNLQLQSDEYNASVDDEDLMIADYLPPPIDIPTIGHCQILYGGSTPNIPFGRSKLFNAVFFDDDGNILTTINPAWDVMILSSSGLDPSHVTIELEGSNEARIRIANIETLICETFELVMTATDPIYGNFEAKVLIEITPFF